MNSKIIIILLGLAVFVFGEDKEFSDLVEDEEFTNKMIECIYDKEKCDDLQFKVRNLLLPELLVRKCESCTPKLRRDGLRLIDFIKERFPTDWLVIANMYDQEIFDIPGYYKTPLVPPL